MFVWCVLHHWVNRLADLISGAVVTREVKVHAGCHTFSNPECWYFQFSTQRLQQMLQLNKYEFEKDLDALCSFNPHQHDFKLK